MSSLDLMNQTATIYPRTSYDAEGREVVGAGESWRCRAQEMSRNVQMPDNQLMTISLVMYFPPTAPLDVDHKITYSGVDYKVFRKYPTPNGDGDTEFIKVECSKWPM